MAAEELKSCDLMWEEFNSDIYETIEDGSKLVYKYKDRMDGPPPTQSPDEKFYADIYLYVN